MKLLALLFVVASACIVLAAPINIAMDSDLAVEKNASEEAREVWALRSSSFVYGTSSTHPSPVGRSQTGNGMLSPKLNAISVPTDVQEMSKQV
ncbi:uncharacterized protein EDB91DRAFT_1251051 [Suillus paluster]|uniref:uncharacterized protein n=1 Tax=Suillus paluster TaxID=48578 RepID=UPI001B861DAA|nr:uncharacterized protein EDB91DRAFT_1251051 [Suillus paluster]KAG1734258.1 hypothetical protein EDB91DRAFT_1251051 [Suillus paluster]